MVIASSSRLDRSKSSITSSSPDPVRLLGLKFSVSQLVLVDAWLNHLGTAVALHLHFWILLVSAPLLKATGGDTFLRKLRP
mmetsp:Transcript_101743/g.160863  ORF Transcript_101743/g.160863 Transcript_101743/m.160863 type:complete len:81 (-) Transcript_101743:28-270(-)